MMGTRLLARASAAAFVVVLAFATGCGDSSRDVLTIRFWNGFTGPDGRTMLRMVRRFNDQNPDVRVLIQRMDWATYYNKLFVAGLGGRAPEVFVLHVDNVARFAQAQFTRPVDDLMPGPQGIPESDLVEYAWGAVEHDGAHYGVPFDVHPLGMYYNKTMFREAGIVDRHGQARPPKTREEFLDALHRMRRDTNGDGAPDQWGFVWTWFRTNVFTLMAQFGGTVLSEDGSRCTLDSEENIRALDFCVSLMRDEHVVPAPEMSFDSWVGFRQGKVGIAFEGVYMLADLRKQDDLDYGAAPLPQLGPRRAAWASSHVLCLRNDLTEEQLDAAWRFIRFLSANSLDWAEGGQVPVRKSLLETERFAHMETQAAFARQLSHIFFLPRVPYVFEVMREFDLAVEKALRGTLPPEEALREATENVEEVIKRHRAMMVELEALRHGD